MNQNRDPEGFYSDEEGRPSVSNLLRRFEKFKLPKVPEGKSVKHAVLFSLSEENSQQDKYVQRSFSDNDDKDSVKKPIACKHTENSNNSERPPVPQKPDLHVLPPTPTSRKLKNRNVVRSFTMRNPVNNMKQETSEQVKIDGTQPYNPEIHETQTELHQDFKDIDNPKNILPVPRPRIQKRQPINKTQSLNSSMKQSDVFEEVSEASNIPPRAWKRSDDVPPRPPTKSGEIPIRPSRRSGDVITDSLNDRGGRNDFVVSKDNNIYGTAINILPLKPKSIREQRTQNKGTQSTSTIIQSKTFHNEFNTAEKSVNSMTSPSKRSPKQFASSSIYIPIYANWPILETPPLPPKSLALRRTMSSSGPSSLQTRKPNLKRNISDLDAVAKLKGLKSIFTATSASKSDKYISLLIDIMVEAIQESSSDVEKIENEEENNAWYDNIRDFVDRETKDYMIQNQLEDINLKVPYDKLLNTMVPKFIKNYVDTDDEVNQNSQSEEENYEKVGIEIKKELNNKDLQFADSSKKISMITNEILQTERNHVRKLESYVDEYSGQLTDIMPKLGKMQCKFKIILEERKNDVLGILKTFLDFDDLFELYVEFICNRMRTSGGEFASLSKDNLKNSDVLSALLLNRLTSYRLFIKNITKQLKEEGERRKVAEEVLKMLNVAMEKCNEAAARAPISSSTSGEGSGSLIFNSPGNTNIFTNIIPASEDSQDYGSLLLINAFKIDNQNTYSTVFLYEEKIVVTKEIYEESFKYQYGLNLNQIVLIPQGKNKKTLKLKDYFKSKSSNEDVIIRFEAKSEETEKCWRRKINECLWAQLKKQKQESKTKLKEVSF